MIIFIIEKYGVKGILFYELLYELLIVFLFILEVYIIVFSCILMMITDIILSMKKRFKNEKNIFNIKP